MTLAPGTKLGPYEIHSPLGAGGMGEVYRARDTRLGRDVAIKVLSGTQADATRLRRFDQEARAIAALSHPNILAIFDVGNGEPPFLVTELLDGETLRARLARGPLPVADAIDVAMQLAAGLAAAHGRGIVHRDLKPENVYLTSDGIVKVLDFGLAKTSMPAIAGVADIEPTRAAATIDGTVLGTIGYMAPEQVRGMPADHRSDLFAVGALLYEMVTGRRAFHGESPADTMSAILREQPTHLTVDGAMPVAVVRIIRRCLEKEPGERFQSAGDVRFALASYAAAPEPASKKAEDKSIAVLPFTSMSADPENQFFGDGLAEELINALTRLPGLRVASRTSSFRFGGRQADVGEIGRTLRVVTVLEGSVRRAANRLRVTAQLIDTANGYHIWAERYDREMADVFDIQDEIVGAIVKALIPALADDARAVVKRPTDNLEAYELYLKGRHYWHQRLPSTMKMAVQCFEQVIALDADYALAYAGLADCYSIYHVYGWFPADQTQPKALEAVTRAVALAPSLPEVNFSRALYTLNFDRQWRDARKYLRKALDANPRMAAVHAYEGLVHAMDGRASDAVVSIDVARELEPLSPFIHYLAASTCNILGRFSDAEQASRQTLELQPDSIIGWWPLSVALCGLGRTREGVEAAERAATISRAPWYVALLAMASGLDGRRDAVDRLLQELHERKSRGEYVSAIGDLEVSLALNDRAAIRAALHACVLDRCAPLQVAATCGWWLEQLRSDPDIDDLLNQVYGRAGSTP